ncbi:MAG: N-acetylglucosamine kinase, partial [Bacteroidetes bacterium]|nr:N-acetylglucosamine kinase [Bacteroidota bacterium]
MAILIADSGATKAEWCLVGDNGRKKTVFTQGISPYFLNGVQVQELLQKELLPSLRKHDISHIYYYGTGCIDPANVKMISGALRKTFPGASVAVTHDLMGAARAVCGH